MKNILKNLFIARGNVKHHAKILTKSGKFYLSIVAGEGLYSSPREFQEDCSYSEVEVAVFTTDTDDWATKEQASPLFPIIGEGGYAYWEEFGCKTAVFGYIPVEKIQECIDAL